MEVQSIELHDFRNYQLETALFSPNLTLVVGNNGQGKTNLLEAIHAVTTLGSHRTSVNGPLVRHGAERAIVRAKGISKSRQIQLDAEVKRTGGFRMLVNKVPLEKASDASSVIASVLFCPEDLELMKGGPEERRRFLDHAAARLRPLAAAERQEFERVLKQRNGVLKAGLVNPRALKQLDVWTEQLVKTGAIVVRNRVSILARLGPVVVGHYTTLAEEREGPQLTYQPSWSESWPFDESEIEAILGKEIEAGAAKDIERGLTQSGPHRDDMAIELNGVDARMFASQGEQRSLALSMRLAERDLVADVRGEQPVLLLDDVFSELDERRKAQLADLVMSSGQTIATSTGVEGLPIKGGKVLRIEEGKVFAYE